MPNYTPGLDDEEDQEQPETFADPTAAPLPPPPTPQDPNVQNASYGLLAGMDPNNIDAKQLLVAQIKQAGMDQKAAQDQAAKDAELKQMEAKQLLYNRLGDRVTNLVGSFTPTPVKMEDNSTNELASRIGSQQQARDKLRQQLLAKSQAGVGGALKGLVDLQKGQSDLDYKRQRDKDYLAGAQQRANTMAAAMAGKEAAKQAAIPEFDKLPKDKQKRIQDINANSDKILSGLLTFDEKITELDKAIAKNDTKAFLQVGDSMLKYLNDPINADALAGPEAARAAPELKFQLGNMLKTGQVVGRDLPGFVSKVKRLSNVLKGAIEKNNALVEDIKSGKNPQLQKWNIDEPSVGGAGTAMGSPALDFDSMSDEELARRHAQLPGGSK